MDDTNHRLHPARGISGRRMLWKVRFAVFVVSVLMLIAIAALIAHDGQRMPPEMKTEFQADLVGFAACLRAGGVELSHPAFSAAGPPSDAFARRIRRARRNPKFPAVSRRCERELPPLLRDSLKSSG